MKNRWLLSTMCGMGLMTASATAALAQNVPSENATAPTGAGAATQTITLKPGQEAGTSTVLPADTSGNPSASMTDARFVRQASAGGMAEIMMGNLAIQRGQTQGERNFGQMLVTDHTRADDQLKAIAQTLLLNTAHGPNAMQRSMYEQAQSAPADQFDAMFNQSMITAHQHTIAIFKMEAQSGENPALRQFAMNTLPVLYKHLHVAERLSPMSSQGMSSMNSANGMNGMNAMGAPPAGQGAMTAPVHGNPDNSADQLNARELNASNPS